MLWLTMRRDFLPTPLGQIDLAAWDDLIGSNLRAPLFLTQAAAPHLRATRGAVVNITDIHAELAAGHLSAVLRGKSRAARTDARPGD